MSFNPFLASDAERGAKGGEQTIERPGHVANVPWQTRPAPLSKFENALADSLTEIFTEGSAELSEVVAALNRRGPTPQSGGTWTEESLSAELARLDL